MSRFMRADRNDNTIERRDFERDLSSGNSASEKIGLNEILPSEILKRQHEFKQQQWSAKI